MDELRAQLGQIERIHAAAASYEKTLVLVRALKAGRLHVDDVEMTNDGWQLVTPAPYPHNGQPVSAADNFVLPTMERLQ